MSITVRVERSGAWFCIAATASLILAAAMVPTRMVAAAGTNAADAAALGGLPDTLGASAETSSAGKAAQSHTEYLRQLRVVGDSIDH
jgi:hypothetical protein